MRCTRDRTPLEFVWLAFVARFRFVGRWVADSCISLVGFARASSHRGIKTMKHWLLAKLRETQPEGGLFSLAAAKRTSRGVPDLQPDREPGPPGHIDQRVMAEFVDPAAHQVVQSRLLQAQAPAASV